MNKHPKSLDNLSFNQILAILGIVCVTALATIIVVGIITQTNTGDTLQTNQQTPVYKTYSPGNLGEVVCTVPSNSDVTILEVFTTNDVPGAEQSMFAGIKAYMIQTSKCKGWILPQYVK